MAVLTVASMLQQLEWEESGSDYWGCYTTRQTMGTSPWLSPQHTCALTAAYLFIKSAAAGIHLHHQCGPCRWRLSYKGHENHPGQLMLTKTNSGGLTLGVPLDYSQQYITQQQEWQTLKQIPLFREGCSGWSLLHYYIYCNTNAVNQVYLLTRIQMRYYSNIQL